MRKYILFLFVLIFSFGVVNAYYSEVASAQVQISGVVAQPAGSFPADGSYALSGTSGNTFQTIYAFSDPLIGPTLEAEDSFTQVGWTPVNAVIGQFHKGLFMNRVAFKGPVARWDISDPLHPKNPFKMDAIGLYDQSTGNGPLPARMWGHEGDMGQVLYAENADGDGRIHIDLANNFSSAMDVAAAIIDGSGKLSMGEKYSDIYSGYEKDGKWIPGIGILSAPGIVVATPTGKYFSYFTGSNNTKIFDITDLSGVVRPTPFGQEPDLTYCYGPDSGCLEHLTPPVTWPNISEWTVVQAPGSDTQYLIGKSNSNILSTTPEKATVRIAQIDPDTGKLLNPKSQTFTGVANLFSNIHFFDNIQPAYVNGKIYILAFEGYSPNSDYVKGQVKIGIYSFDTTNLSLTRTGEILFNNITGQYSKMSHMLSVVNSEDGSGYPLLEMAMAGTTGNNGSQLNGDDTFNFYSLKDFLGKNSADPTPAFIMHPVPHKTRFIEGDVLVNQWPQNNNAFLKSENGKINLYVYRVAAILEGTRAYGDYPYSFSTFKAADPAYVPPTAAERVDIVKTLAGTDKGDMGFRVDRIDVTSLTGTGSSTTPTPTSPSDTTVCATGVLINTTTGDPCNSSCTISTQILKNGSTGDAVKALQTQLNVEGANLTVDGNFGPQTEQAVKDFQQRHSLTVDGIVGPKTAALTIMYCQGPIKTYGTPPAPTAPPVPTTNIPPAIDPTITGPTTLNINQEGAWTITATDPNNDDLAWSVEWNTGEGRTIQTCSTSPSSNKQNWSYNISHAWDTAGTYTVTVFTGDCRGGTATPKTFTVTVSGGGGSPANPLMNLY
jgi:peptidoglycan hydrolase-like protein with peptidoglycan-binding domain